ncbi:MULTISPECIES: universal stress protein [unclassified Blastococcus]
MTTQQMPPEPAARAAAGHGRTAGRPERWVVGVDGSPGARAALVWALGAAARAGATLELVSAYPIDYYGLDPYLVDVGRLDAIREDTEARVRGFLADARQDPALTAVPGAADVEAEVLVCAGAPAEHLVAHAPCPAVVVHPGAVQPPPRVVVGVDDSAVSRAALARAADEARQRDAELEVVAVFQPEAYWSDLYAVTAPPLSETLEQARVRTEQLVAGVLGAGADVRLRVLAGAPAEGLVQAADGAALLVVGSRSTSRLAGMLLGSVALHCAVHAPCPVMVVHAEPAPAEAAEAAPVSAEPAPVPTAG